MPQNVLQLLLHEGALTEAELIEHVVACVEAHARAAKANNLRVPPTEEGRQEFMRKIVLEDISPQLERLGMKVAMKKFDGTPYFGLVNIRDDEQRLASDLGKPQNEFFHLVVSAIQAASDKSIDAVDAGNLRLEMKVGKLTIDEVDECISHLISGGWLQKSADSFYTLGIRSELQLMYLTQKDASATEEL